MISNIIFWPNEQFANKFFAMAIGNIMEWFDFASFGALADIIGELFFPSDDSTTQLLKSLSLIGAAFVMRPLGGIILGRIGDIMGRKPALELSIGLMLVPSFLIGCLPTYQMCGSVASLLLITMRLLQGLACGGELIGAFLYTIEATEGQNMGFWGGACKSSGNLGSSIGIGLVMTLRMSLTKDQLFSWGWRVPFLAGILFSGLGLWLRSKLQDENDMNHLDLVLTKKASNEQVLPNELGITEVNGTGDQKSKLNSKQSGNPIWTVLQSNKREIICILFTASLWGCGYYTCFVWLMYFMSDFNLIDPCVDSSCERKSIPMAWAINFLMNCLLVIGLPMGGLVGDYLGEHFQSYEKGNKCAIVMGQWLMVTTAIPAMILICSFQPYFAALGQFLLVISLSIFGGNLPCFMVTQFPFQNRYSGVGIAYNFAHAIFSSTAAIIQTTLVTSKPNPLHHQLVSDWLTDSRIYPAYYLMTIALISFFAITFSTRWKPLGLSIHGNDSHHGDDKLEQQMEDFMMPVNVLQRLKEHHIHDNYSQREMELEEIEKILTNSSSADPFDRSGAIHDDPIMTGPLKLSSSYATHPFYESNTICI